MMYYDYRIQANFFYDPGRVYDQASESSLKRFTELLWHGYDEGGPTVYKKDPYTGDVVRIDFRR
jgi:hypothetical protein